jgi:uncharacterized secreted protein with C-terminal beta-propeller domain
VGKGGRSGSSHQCARAEGIWSDTEALRDHHTFLFARSKNLLAIPVSKNQYDHDKYTTIQGLFVFNITLTEGFALRGNITHQDVGDAQWDNTNYVRRALYIKDVLYTVSDKKIRLNSLGNLMSLKEIPFS